MLFPFVSIVLHLCYPLCLNNVMLKHEGHEGFHNGLKGVYKLAFWQPDTGDLILLRS
jgi:hypothetical protein